MLKRENRLISTYDFRRIRRFGRKLSSLYFHLYYLPAFNSNDPTRAGIVVSTKFHKSAVVRNRVKRVFSEIIRLNFDKIERGWLLVIYPRQSVLDADYEKISTDFTEAIQTLSLPGESGDKSMQV